MFTHKIDINSNEFCEQNVTIQVLKWLLKLLKEKLPWQNPIIIYVKRISIPYPTFHLNKLLMHHNKFQKNDETRPIKESQELQ